jgi:hypothetical protein
MSSHSGSEGWNALVDELKQLETFFPLLGVANEREEILEEIRELEELIAAAGRPDDEQSLRALNFLQAELAHKRQILARL